MKRTRANGIIDKLALGEDLTRGRQRIQKASRTWYMWGPVEILLILFFAAVDYGALSSLFDNSMVASRWVITLTTAGACVIENFLASVAGRLYHEAVTLGDRRARKLLAGTVGVDLVFLLGLLLFRFVSRGHFPEHQRPGAGRNGATVTVGTGDDGTRLPWPWYCPGPLRHLGRELPDELPLREPPPPEAGGPGTGTAPPGGDGGPAPGRGSGDPGL